MRTVVVRPDGTIVSSDAVPVAGDAPASTDAPRPATAEVPQTPEVPPVATNDDTAAIAGGTGGQELAITANPGAAGGTAAETPAPRQGDGRDAGPAEAEAQPKVATSGDDGPIDLTPGTGKSTTEVASRTPGGQGALPLATGGMMVQVSSQRFQDAAQATFRDLQTRYPAILGSYNADIQRADLGDRGIYFRVRVGPFASADAQNLCRALKNAGGDCILARADAVPSGERRGRHQSLHQRLRRTGAEPRRDRLLPRRAAVRPHPVPAQLPRAGADARSGRRPSAMRSAAPMRRC